MLQERRLGSVVRVYALHQMIYSIISHGLHKPSKAVRASCVVLLIDRARQTADVQTHHSPFSLSALFRSVFRVGCCSGPRVQLQASDAGCQIVRYTVRDIDYC